MSVKTKRLVNPYEERMLEFLQTCLNANYKIHTQVSLCQFCEIERFLYCDLRKFLFSSSVDALITDDSYNPCLVIEFQSQYHDSAEAKERDRKKSVLLHLAGVPLIYSRIKDFGLLHIYSDDEEVVFNLFTGQGREKAQALIKKYCQKFTYSKLEVAAC
ncbi:hypothetical protein Cri9333_4443 [Crinalium epipsammum PCC 9333]|uniref:DUF2726 domain-containing protein n=1 Tax=Crinalium epipsammum PCC 9333 TaxID=1173022 RepID=K9W4V7_9CYAN|nr:DUF2726 domain-containing protein [Crinalium epipsammum]AFZ15226.1 hypothetical protein Cri9333_4443 [Crinalium epipsammum PCC 9333]